MTTEAIKIRISNLLFYAHRAFYEGDIATCDRLLGVVAEYRNALIELGTYE